MTGISAGSSPREMRALANKAPSTVGRTGRPQTIREIVVVANSRHLKATCAGVKGDRLNWKAGLDFLNKRPSRLVRSFSLASS